jgi:hypothetical protein
VGGTYNLPRCIHQGLLKLGLHDKQQIEMWSIHGVVGAMVISIADYVFSRQKSMG